MDNRRPVVRLAIVTVVAVLVGCGTKTATDSGSGEGRSDESGQVSAARTVDHLRVAKQKLLLQDFDAAADAAYKALVQDPDGIEATLVAAQVESGRGNHQIAIDLASTIDPKSTFGKDAVEVEAFSLAKLDRLSDAADVLLEGLMALPEMSTWRHRAWDLLNQVGRREEASLQAESLCIASEATQQELLSLTRRDWSFPFALEEGEDPTDEFAPGLGMARWHYTQLDFRRGLEELAPQYEADAFESPAASALYGRMLTETQSFEEFRRWYARCDDRVQQLGDYWAALGVYFYDERQYEASARALLESVYRNPTDRVSFQRLSKAFGSLERVDLGQQFRHRGVKISETEKLAEKIEEAPAERILKLELARGLAELGRPFEMLQWSRMVLTPSNQRERIQLDNQIQALRGDPKAFQMASAVSLCGVSMDEYSLQQGMESLQAFSEPATQEKPKQAQLLARPRLSNVANEVGIDFQWYQDVEMNLAVIPIHESLGGGIGVLDYDLDGWPDVYLGQGSGDPPTDQCTRSNVLVRNLDGVFTEVTQQAVVQDFNYTSGIAAGDVNQDGFADLWIGSLGHNRLLLNNGDGTFQEITDKLQCDDQFTSSLAIGDINGDTLPDLFEANYVAMEGGFALPEIGPDGKPKLPGPLSHLAGFDRWFENLGNGEFGTHVIPLEISEPGTSLGVIVTDFDSSGTNQVFVGNDVRANHLLVHRGDDVLYNVADVKGVANGFQGVPNGCMGISAADFNRDGLIDIYISNYYNEANNLYIQDASSLFTDVAIRYGLSELSIPMVGFGTKAIDLDRNGWLDLMVTNGHIFDTRIFDEKHLFQMSPQMLMSEGNRFELAEVEDDSGYWGQMYLGRAMASLDFNRDGLIDLLIGHMDAPVALLRNETQSPGNWIQFELIGTKCERDAIGARAVVHVGGESFTQWVTAGDGYLCSDEPVLDFGLGTLQGPVRIDIHWPAGDVQSLTDLTPGRRYLVIEGEDAAFPRMR